ncbi:hypothetical protein ABT024_04935 [Streptomyces sp. NPDC002812]|uniref:hypothetical protein n=1 Tax=Streptomyces sp. NPDC002812 TaxID=3154434 RepID=UPI003326286E
MPDHRPGDALRERATELEGRVPPAAARPRTDDERMFLERAAALRANADTLEHTVQAPAALRLALDDAARALRSLGLSLDGPPTWAHTDSSTEWADRAGQLFQTLELLAARIEPYAESPAAAARRVRAAADAVANRRGTTS